MAGDTVTSIDRAEITRAAQLRRGITVHDPGERVKVPLTDGSGPAGSVDVTLTQAPVV